jgi:hypothetical protein
MYEHPNVRPPEMVPQMSGNSGPWVGGGGPSIGAGRSKTMLDVMWV